MTHTNQTALDLDALEALAIAYECENANTWYNAFEVADGITYEPSVDFITNVSPTTILSLIQLARGAQLSKGATASMQECSDCNGQGCTHYPDGEWEGKCAACSGTGIASPSSPRPSKPVAWIATDLDGRADVGLTKEEAKRRAGEGCTEFIPLYDVGSASAAGAGSEQAPTFYVDRFAISELSDGRFKEVCASLYAEPDMGREPVFLAAPSSSASEHIPALPEPDFMCGDCSAGESAYTADQMREYGQACARAAHQAATNPTSGDISQSAPISTPAGGPAKDEKAAAANAGSRVLMDQWNAGAALLLFQEWKAYPLPEFNADGNFDADWLHREWVAFQAGLKRRAAATSAGSLTTDSIWSAHRKLRACFRRVHIQHGPRRCCIAAESKS
jgi:hypothetical protein